MPKRVNRDTEVIIVNNTKGGFSERIPGGISIVLNEYGDTAYINHGELVKLLGRGRAGRRKFEKMDIVISEVVTDGVTIKNITDELRLTKPYEELHGLLDTEFTDDIDYIDVDKIDLFLNECEYDELEKIMNNKKSYVRKTLAEHAADLHKRGELNDFNKMSIIATGLGQNERDIQSFWTDIREANKYQV